MKSILLSLALFVTGLPAFAGEYAVMSAFFYRHSKGQLSITRGEELVAEKTLLPLRKKNMSQLTTTINVELQKWEEQGYKVVSNQVIDNACHMWILYKE